MKPIYVVEYDPLWPQLFEILRSKIWNAVGEFAVSIEHVGSTSIPGLSAKPIIDMTVVVAKDAGVARAIEQLATLGYEHVGNLGVEGREAFKNPPSALEHHLYVCPQGSLGLRNHLAVRDYLRSHPDVAQAYGKLKQELARRYRHDLDAYIAGKTDFILEILRMTTLTKEELASIVAANRQP